MIASLWDVVLLGFSCFVIGVLVGMVYEGRDSREQRERADGWEQTAVKWMRIARARRVKVVHHFDSIDHLIGSAK